MWTDKAQEMLHLLQERNLQQKRRNAGNKREDVGSLQPSKRKTKVVRKL